MKKEIRSTKARAKIRIFFKDKKNNPLAKVTKKKDSKKVRNEEEALQLILQKYIRSYEMTVNNYMPRNWVT